MSRTSSIADAADTFYATANLDAVALIDLHCFVVSRSIVNGVFCLITTVGTACKMIFLIYLSILLLSVALIHLDVHTSVLITFVWLDTRADLTLALMSIFSSIERYRTMLLS